MLSLPSSISVPAKKVINAPELESVRISSPGNTSVPLGAGWIAAPLVRITATWPDSTVIVAPWTTCAVV
jgi:hypothetical protein